MILPRWEEAPAAAGCKNAALCNSIILERPGNLAVLPVLESSIEMSILESRGSFLVCPLDCPNLHTRSFLKYYP